MRISRSSVCRNRSSSRAECVVSRITPSVVVVLRVIVVTQSGQRAVVPAGNNRSSLPDLPRHLPLYQPANLNLERRDSTAIGCHVRPRPECRTR